MIDATPDVGRPILSICMATFRRASFLAETLDSIVPQLDARVELVIVDGASPDNTAEIVNAYIDAGKRISYHREAVNSGVDADYDKAVGYAQGEYCWLMTDDDLITEDAVDRIVQALGSGPDMVVVNAEVRDASLGHVLVPKLLRFDADKEYRPGQEQSLLAELAPAMSFIATVVIRRDFWLARDARAYYGSLFVHVGVIFQKELPSRTMVLATPLVVARYGNAMWQARGFEIWVFKWPQLIWSFPGFSDQARQRVCRREAWKIPRKLWLFRSLGAYSATEYDRYISGFPASIARTRARLIARVPGKLANAIAALYCLLFARGERIPVYDLARSTESTWMARTVARILDIPCA